MLLKIRETKRETFLMHGVKDQTKLLFKNIKVKVNSSWEIICQICLALNILNP